MTNGHISAIVCYVFLLLSGIRLFIVQVMDAKKGKRKLVDDELNELTAKKARLLKDIDALVKSADSFALQAETKGDLTLIAKSNALRKSSQEKSTTELPKLLQLITDKQLELQNC